MKKWLSLSRVVILLLLCIPAGVQAQELGHFDGYSMGDPAPAPSGSAFNARGLMTGLYPPLISDFAGKEYTWVIEGLLAQASTYFDSTYTTTYDVTGGRITVWEDSCQDARPTFYACPGDVNGLDPRYGNNCTPGGGHYLRGHFSLFRTTFDAHAEGFGDGTFLGVVTWDSGTHINNLQSNQRCSWSLGGVSAINYPCIPVSADPTLGPYRQALTGRIFRGGQMPIECATVAVRITTWGSLRRVYR